MDGIFAECFGKVNNLDSVRNGTDIDADTTTDTEFLIDVHRIVGFIDAVLPFSIHGTSIGTESNDIVLSFELGLINNSDSESFHGASYS